MAEKNILSEDDNQEAEEYVAVETPLTEGEDQAGESAEEAAEGSDDGDDGISASADSEEDARLSEEDSDEESSQKSKKQLTPEEKRAQRQNRKFRRRAAIEHKERELAFLRAENEEFKRRLSMVEQQTSKFNVSAVDQKLNEALNEAQLAERIMAKAIEQGQGEDATKALQIRDQALDRARQLRAAKEEAEKPVPQSKPGKDPRVAAYAKEWIEANNWYDPSGRDEDSAIVKIIDQRLAAEGYNPASEDYWIELDNRVSRRLPHRYQEDASMAEVERPAAKAAPTRKGPPVGGKREYAPPSTRKEVYISPERKQALVDAGVWDNPELRQKYIKRYAEYDRNSSSR
jgi:hypothetical protein